MPPPPSVRSQIASPNLAPPSNFVTPRGWTLPSAVNRRDEAQTSWVDVLSSNQARSLQASLCHGERRRTARPRLASPSLQWRRGGKTRKKRTSSTAAIMSACACRHIFSNSRRILSLPATPDTILSGAAVSSLPTSHLLLSITCLAGERSIPGIARFAATNATAGEAQRSGNTVMMIFMVPNLLWLCQFNVQRQAVSQRPREHQSETTETQPMRNRTLFSSSRKASDHTAALVARHPPLRLRQGTYLPRLYPL